MKHRTKIGIGLLTLLFLWSALLLPISAAESAPAGTLAVSAAPAAENIAADTSAKTAQSNAAPVATNASADGGALEATKETQAADIPEADVPAAENVMMPFALPGEITVSITDITAPADVYQGDLTEISIHGDLTSPPGSAMQAGDYVAFAANLGELFVTDWNQMANVPIYDLSGENIVAHAKLTEINVTMTFADDFQDAANFTFTINTGKKLQALDVGATADTPVPMTLTVADKDAQILFQAKGPGPVTPAPTPEPQPSDPVTINHATHAKGASVTDYGSAAWMSFDINQNGALGLFYRDGFPNWLAPFAPLQSALFADQIPAAGIIDPETVKIYAVCHNFSRSTANNTQGFAPGLLYPIETGSQWHELVRDHKKFTLLQQNPDESFADFRSRVASQQLSYGIYTDPETDGDTFLANFGDMSSDGLLPYTDFEPNLITNTPDLADIYGDQGPSAGKVVSYRIEFKTYYPKLRQTTELTNTGTVETLGGSFDALAKYTITNSGGIGIGRIGTLNLRVVDRDERTKPIPGAVFKLQQKNGEIWEDVVAGGETLQGTSDANGYLTLGKLPFGDYRVVQTSTAEGYAFDNTTYGPVLASDGATIGYAPTPTGAFTIAPGDKMGYMTFVTNARMPAPSPSPAPTPEPTVTPRPEPSPTPLPVPTEAPMPEPTPAPWPTPAPTPTPTPVPTTLPEPTGTTMPWPTPAPTPTPAPVPTTLPEPTGTAMPWPTPAPTPTPAPVPTTLPEPTGTTMPWPTPAPTSSPEPEPVTTLTQSQPTDPPEGQPPKTGEAAHKVLPAALLLLAAGLLITVRLSKKQKEN